MTVVLKNQSRTKKGDLTLKYILYVRGERTAPTLTPHSPAYPGDGYVGLASDS